MYLLILSVNGSTRVTRKLLDHYGIATPLTPYHDHIAAEARPKLIARLAARLATIHGVRSGRFNVLWDQASMNRLALGSGGTSPPLATALAVERTLVSCWAPALSTFHRVNSQTPGKPRGA